MRSCAKEDTPKTRTSNPCPHPEEELSHFGDVTICQHCWTQVDLQVATTLEDPETEEEDQAHAVSAA